MENCNNLNTNKFRLEPGNDVLDKVCSFFQIDMPKLTETELKRQVQELCIIRLCMGIGVKNLYNSKNTIVRFYAAVMGQAVSDALNLRLHIAPDCVRLVRYNGINFVDSVKGFLEQEDIGDAMIDTFNLIDDNKALAFKIQDMF